MKVLFKEKLSPHKYKTAEGYLVCQDAILTRTGPQEYTSDEVFNDGNENMIEIYRSPEQVFDTKTMYSFENVPLTIEHPDGQVTPENFKDLVVGSVHDIRKSKVDGEDVLIGNIIINDAEAIRDVEDGSRTDLSCGYDCEVVKDNKGRYQQVRIRGNHVALCRQGRAGIAHIIDSSENIGSIYKGKRFRDSRDDSFYIVDSVKNGYYKLNLENTDERYLVDSKQFKDYFKEIKDSNFAFLDSGVSKTITLPVGSKEEKNLLIWLQQNGANNNFSKRAINKLTVEYIINFKDDKQVQEASEFIKTGPKKEDTPESVSNEVLASKKQEQNEGASPNIYNEEGDKENEGNYFSLKTDSVDSFNDCIHPKVKDAEEEESQDTKMLKELKNIYGEETYNKILEYLKSHKEVKLIDLYNNEDDAWNKFEKWRNGETNEAPDDSIGFENYSSNHSEKDNEYIPQDERTSSQKEVDNLFNPKIVNALNENQKKLTEPGFVDTEGNGMYQSAKANLNKKINNLKETYKNNLDDYLSRDF